MRRGTLIAIVVLSLLIAAAALLQLRYGARDRELPGPRVTPTAP